MLRDCQNLESWRLKKLSENFTTDGQDWWWFSKHNMYGKFDGIYIKSSVDKHYEWHEEEKRKI